MAFDEARYQREVLDAGLPVRDDLRHRYQLREPLTPAGVAAAVEAARSCWRRYRGRLKYRPVIEQLEVDHPAHRELFDAARGGDLAPLREELAEQAGRAAAARRQLSAALGEASDGIGMITRATLRQAGLAYGADAALLREVRLDLGLTIAEPDPLPVELPHPAYARCGRHLALLRLRHLSDFLDATGPGDRTSRPVEPFTGPAPTEQEVAQAAGRWGRLPHGAAHTAAQAVAAAARTVVGEAGPEGLRGILRWELAQPLRALHAARAGAARLLAHATGELSVAPEEARRLVFAVLHEQPADPLTARLRALVADGLLMEASVVAERFPPAAREPAAAALAARLDATVQEARRLTAEAARHGASDPDLAWTLLDEAEALVRDLPRIAEVRRSLPTRPVPLVTAVAGRAGVLVDWEPSPSTAGPPHYVLVRSPHCAPRSTADGDRPALPRPGLSLLDTGAPVNLPLYYGVAVLRGSEPAGPPSPLTVCGPVRYRPEVDAAALTAADGSVTGGWRPPAGAEAVRVTRHSDAEPRGRRLRSRRDGFADHGLPNGVVHRYLVQAVYLDEDGTASATEGVWLSATPLARPRPVTGLDIAPVPEDPELFEARVRPGMDDATGEVRLYAFEEEPRWPVGERVATAELSRDGSTLSVQHFTDGALRFRLPRPSAVVLAATVAGDRAVVGARALVASAPRLRGARASRGPGEAVVTFAWPPDGPSEVELSWDGPDGVRRRRVVTRLGYAQQGGARLPVPDGPALDVEVRLLGRPEGLRTVAAPVRLTLPAWFGLDYTLTRPGLPGRRSVRAVVRSTTPVRVPGLLLVSSPGPTWPLAAGDGVTLAELTDVDLAPHRPAVLTAPLPRGHTGWVRCFAVGDGIVMTDPAPHRLRRGRGGAGP
ncbi:hypothetical protein ACIBCA_18715 [Kitasatospora sp. NPDC051170]|uniref:hypothetical protein n=1 Tax=Kitasatospora sp. NPDC051170 TaxID=3364056 RepID=UPI0037900C46